MHLIKTDLIMIPLESIKFTNDTMALHGAYSRENASDTKCLDLCLMKCFTNVFVGQSLKKP